MTRTDKRQATESNKQGNEQRAYKKHAKTSHTQQNTTQQAKPPREDQKAGLVQILKRLEELTKLTKQKQSLEIEKGKAEDLKQERTETQLRNLLTQLNHLRYTAKAVTVVVVILFGVLVTLLASGCIVSIFKNLFN